MSTMRPTTIVYPDSDGKPMAENTLQYQWITTIQGNIDAIFAQRDDVFVAGDNLIYPVEGHPEICNAPDVYVAIGRPKGHRGSYKVWEEDGIFPQVVFEVRSPSNTRDDMEKKLAFYNTHGAKEYYDYDPDRNRLRGYRRVKGSLVEIKKMDGWVSPLLGIRFVLAEPQLLIFYPDGSRFLTIQEHIDQREEAEQREKEAKREAAAAKRRAETAKRRAESAERRMETVEHEIQTVKHEAEAAKREAELLKAKLRELGIDPNAI